jgi:hypothetical protein
MTIVNRNGFTKNGKSKTSSPPRLVANAYHRPPLIDRNRICPSSDHLAQLVV